MKTKNALQQFMGILGDGIIKNNPTFRLVLGMCPTLAVTTSASNGLGMGLATAAVLVCSNAAISALRKFIPDKIRIPAFIVVIASFVTIVGMLMEAYVPSLFESLGKYIALIVVNCIILGRAEAYAYKTGVTNSIADGIGVGLGFTLSLTLLGSVRELIGAGTWFGMQIMPAAYQPMLIMILPPGAFLTLGLLMALFNALYKRFGKEDEL